MSRKNRHRSIPVRIFYSLIKVMIIVLILAVGLNVYVIKTTEDRIAARYTQAGDTVSDDELERLKSIDADCIMVLGASVNSDGTPSSMLKDRLDTAIDLYRSGAAPKLLLSGDNGQVVYNEVQGMKNYAMEAGVSEEDIFLDHAGFSTYESVYRAGYIFEVDSIIVVTQTYHLYRALYGCERMGMTALGAASDQDTYSAQERREIREVLARDKDFIKWVFKPEPTFLGEVIPISDNGGE